MRFLALAAAVSSLAIVAVPAVVAAQTPMAPAQAGGPTLTLAEAIAQARRNNPAFQTTLNSRRSAEQQLRTSTGVFLPSLSSSFSSSYREGKAALVQGQAFGATNNTMDTGGGLSTSLSFAPSMLSDRHAASTAVKASDFDIAAAEQTLRVNITNLYIAVLQAQANAQLQDTLLVTNSAQLDLARAKMQVGTGTQLDVEQADVANGTQRVAVLRARNDIDIAKLRLYQQMGIEPSLGVQLAPLNAVTLPGQSITELIDMARKANPGLEAARTRDEQSGYTVTSAHRQYLPSFSISTGLSGYTNRFSDTDALIASGQSNAINSKASCIRSEEVRAALNLTNRLATCNSIAFTASDEALIRESQSKFPFGFTRNGYGVTASLSLPIFNGFRREAGVENAKIARRNAQNALRTEELALTADVSAAYLNLTTSQQAVQIQEQTVATARRALTLAEQRYKVGTISLVELVQSRSAFSQAETSRINAIYDFQRAFAQLEAAVGRPLR